MDIIRSEAGLAADVRAMIEQTREAVARTVNAGMTLLYWRVGRRIQVEILKNQRAEYGGEILATRSQELSADFGKGFSYSALTRMLRFAETFPEASIVSTLSRQLGWFLSPNTSPPCRPANSCSGNSTPPSRFPGQGWKRGRKTHLDERLRACFHQTKDPRHDEMSDSRFPGSFPNGAVRRHGALNGLPKG